MEATVLDAAVLVRAALVAAVHCAAVVGAAVVVAGSGSALCGGGPGLLVLMISLAGAGPNISSDDDCGSCG